MRLYKQPTEAQSAKIRKNWSRLQRWGVARFILLGGLGMFCWMVLCWVGFTSLYGHAAILRMPFVWKATIPDIALMAFIFPTSYYFMVRLWARRINA